VAWYPGPDATLAPAAPAPAESRYAYDPVVGIASLAWDPWTTTLDPAIPGDQSADDARSLAFTSAPLATGLELVGSPSAVLDVGASGPLCLVAKLADVAPNGRSTLVTLGWLDLGGPSRDRRRVMVPLRATGYRVPAGHRLRLSLACADFPRLWPTPQPAELTLHHGASHILLPVAAEEDDELPAPVWGPLQAAELHGPADLGSAQRWETRRDLGADAVTLDGTKEEHQQLDPATGLHSRHHYVASVSARRPDAARMQSTTEVRIERPVGRIELAVTTLTTTYQVAVTASITVDGSPFWTRTWSRSLGGQR
jgi:hypothetical protein